MSDISSRSGIRAFYIFSQRFQKFNSRLSQIGASIAAAVAMSVALFFAIYTDRTFLDNTLLWIILTIIAYVCKDRIKE